MSIFGGGGDRVGRDGQPESHSVGGGGEGGGREGMGWIMLLIST